MRTLRGGRQVDRLHHAQAQGGQGGRRHDHGAPPRPGHRHDDRRRLRGRPRVDDGRPDRRAPRSTRGRRSPEPAVLAIRSLTVRDDAEPAPRRRPLARGPGRRDRRASPGWRATGRPSSRRPWSAYDVRPPGRSRSTAGELAGRSPREILRAGVAYVPEDRQRDGLISTFSVADNLVLDQYDVAPFASGPAIKRSAVRSNGRRTRGVLRHPHARRSTRPPARCPAATSRRSSSPANCPGPCG